MSTAGLTSRTATRRSASGYGRGFRRTPLTMLKIAVLAPMPIVIVTTVMTVNIGERSRVRITYRS
jgi:hypothetical protein